MDERFDVTSREWGLFGLRLISPLGLLAFLFLGNFQLNQQTFLIGSIAVGLYFATSIILGVVFAGGEWSSWMIGILSVVDLIIAGTCVVLISIGLAWLLIAPLIVIGFYFDWLYGLLTGMVTALLLLIGEFLLYGAELSTGILTLITLGVIATAPLVNLLNQSGAPGSYATRSAVQDNKRRADRVTRLATEYMRVVYEMAEVLSKSRLEPRRVMSSAVEFAMEGLERVGVEPPLFGMILLFAESDRPGEAFTVLRVAYKSRTVAERDAGVSVPGLQGAIDQTIRSGQPVITQDPLGDPELSQFRSLRECKSILCLPLRSGNEFYGVMICGTNNEAAFNNMHRELMMAVAHQAAASLNNARLYVSLRDQRDRIVEVEKVARAQLAGELHDGPTQGVAAITMRLNYIRKLIEKRPEQATNELYQIEDMARRTAKEIRAMLFELRPKALESGLEPGLQQLAIKAKDTYEQNVAIYVEENVEHYLDSQTRHTLFSIAVESLNNARKHANAELITVNLRMRADTIIMEIADNGEGFDVEAALIEARHREGHLGLLNLQERAALVEGTMHLESELGAGTTLTVLIPMGVLRARLEEERERLHNEQFARYNSPSPSGEWTP